MHLSGPKAPLNDASLSLKSLIAERGLLKPEEYAAAFERAGGNDSMLIDAAVALGFVPSDQADTLRESVDKIRAELGVAHYLRDLGLVSETDIEAAFKLSDGHRLALTAEPRVRAVALPENVAEALRQAENDLGRYVLVSRLGTGGAGSVWKAWQKDLRRFVAVKFLELTGQADEERFRREALLLSQIEHPNIARVYDAGDIKGKPYLVMQYIEGQTLDRLTLTPDGVARTILTVAEALHAAHVRGIVHRDIKPTNILIDTQNQVFVMDFGLAKRLDLPARITMTGTVMGTPAYMSPEQARGRLVDARTDVYSLGATAYELLTGKPPQEGTSLIETLDRISNHEAVPPRKVNPKIPLDLETIVLKCLSKEKERRYATAAELADDLRRYLNGEPILAKPITLAYRLRRRVTRHPWVAVATAVAVLLSLAFGAFVLGARMSRERQKLQWVREGEEAQASGLSQKALQAYERAHALEPWDGDLRARKDAMAQIVHEEHELLKKEVERAQLQKQAAQVYRDAERELYLLRVRSYQAGWRLTQTDFSHFEELIERCLDQLRRAGASAEGWWVVGRAYQVLGNWESALVAYDAALGIDAGHAESLVDKARLQIERALLAQHGSVWDSDRHRNAETWMREALDLLQRGVSSGKVAPIELDLAHGYELVVVGKSAREYCMQMLAKWANQDFREEFFLVRGLAHWDDMLQDASEAIAIRPGFYQAYFWRAIARVPDDLKGAVEDLSRALDINPRFAEAYNARGVASSFLKDDDGAIRDYTRAIAITTRYAQAYFNRAISHRNKGDLTRAIEDYTRAIDLNPRYLAAYNNRANIRTLQEDFTGALDDLSRAISLGQPYAELYISRGVARIGLKDYTTALADFNEAIRIDPRSASAYYNRGHAHVRLQDWDRAIEDFSLAIERDPKMAGAYNNRGLARVSKGDAAGAIEDYTRAIGFNRQFAEAYFNRALAYRVLGKTREAVEDLSAAIAMNPQNVDAWFHRGVVCLQLRNFEEAIRDFSGVIERDSKRADAWVNRGIAYWGVQDGDHALADVTHAIELNSEMAEAYFNRGLVQLNLHRLQEALADFDRALKINPKYVSAYANRAVAREIVEDFQGALDDYAKALSFKTDFPEALYSRGLLHVTLSQREPNLELKHLRAAAEDLDRALKVAEVGWPHRAAVEQTLDAVRARLAKLREH